MAIIHLILQGKGGVGKSMIASMLVQVIKHKGKELMAFDTDPVNATLESFTEFDVKRIDIMKNGNIDARMFDPLQNALAEAPEEVHVVVDNGSSSFVALCSYIEENDMLSMLSDLNHTVYFHTVITGGQGIGDTIRNLKKLALSFPDTPLVIWLNPYFGDVEMDGKNFEQFKVYTDHLHQFKAVITLPIGNRNLIGKDLEELFAKRQSFQVGITNSPSIAVRSRLNKFWKQIIACVDQADII